MKISELSRLAGVPVSTIKFYIREGLLPSGELSQRNQAMYGQAHLERLDLIRALREVAGLSLDTVRDVFGSLGKAWSGEGDPVGTALQVVYQLPDRDRSASEEEEFQQLRETIKQRLMTLDWVLPEPYGFSLNQHTEHLYLDQLTDAVIQYRKHLDPELPLDVVERFADVAWLFSDVVFMPDLTDGRARVPAQGDDITAAARSGILGTLLTESLITPLLRTALMMRSAYVSQDLEAPPTVVDKAREVS